MGKTKIWSEIRKLKLDVRTSINTLNEYGLISDKDGEKLICRALKHPRATYREFRVKRR